MKRSTVEISNRAVGQIKKGSLWIFANEFVTKMSALQPGAWVDFVSQKQFVGTGYANPHSLIAGRICSSQPIEDLTLFFKNKLQGCLKRRGELIHSGSFRAVFSEGDELPGLIVDVYGDAPQTVVVAQITTAGMESVKAEIVESLKEVFKPQSLVLRCDNSIRALEKIDSYTEVVTGDEAILGQGQVREADVLFAADFVDGQKTGFFLDQRDNRQHLKSLARGLRGLDLCCYSGGWGLSALKGGAEHVTFVDQSQEAMDLVARGLRLNEFSSSKAALVTSDVFDFLEKTPQKFDVVVADPPAFVKSKKNLPQAVKAYTKLNVLALKALNSGGLLCTCSCSFHLSEQDFEQILMEALAKTEKVGRVLHRGRQSSDHPWILNRPETKYLKCLILKID